MLAKFTSPAIVFLTQHRTGPYLFYIEKFATQFKTTEKIIAHHSRFRENDDLRLWGRLSVKKKPPFSNASAVKLCAVGFDAQFNTRKWHDDVKYIHDVKIW